MYNKFIKKQKPSVLKGRIKEINVSEKITPANPEYKDFYLHTLSVECENGDLKIFDLRQMSKEIKFPVETFVCFRFNKASKNEFKNPLIEAKSLAKSFTKEELSQFNKPIEMTSKSIFDAIQKANLESNNKPAIEEPKSKVVRQKRRSYC